MSGTVLDLELVPEGPLTTSLFFVPDLRKTVAKLAHYGYPSSYIAK